MPHIILEYVAAAVKRECAGISPAPGSWLRGSVHPRLQSPYIAVLSVSVLSLLVIGVIAVMKVDPVAAYAGLTGIGIYFLLPLLIATSCAIIVFSLRNQTGGLKPWSGIVAPAISIFALTLVFLFTTLNLIKVVVFPSLVLVSLIAVITVPVIGFLVSYWSKEEALL